MAKIQKKSEKLTPFGGFFMVMDAFERILSPVIDKELGLRSTLTGYQYSEILRSLMCVYFCGGSCVEDVTSHLMPHLSQHPRLRTCSADTILRGVCGIFGTLMTGLFALDGGAFYSGGFGFFGAQLFGIIVIDLWAAATSIILFWGIKKIAGLRVDKRIEEEGLDIYEHGESCYN